MNNLEKLRLSTKEDIFNLIKPNESNIRLDEPGCYDDALWSSLLVNSKDELSILELGTWYGYGAVRVAQKLKSLNKNFNIVCVDTWLGSPEHIINNASVKELKLKNGYPTFYYDFLEVVKFFKQDDVIIPFPNTTVGFLNVARAYNCKFDFIVIDASHQYEDVKIDLEIAWELLNDGGYIIGDDLSWPGVQKAANEFLNDKKVQAKSTHNQYIIRK